MRQEVQRILTKRIKTPHHNAPDLERGSEPHCWKRISCSLALINRSTKAESEANPTSFRSR
uniref:Uncharacterized protein n=1 Tax=Cucumis melo TaxID=3656 RepID=A0A9I9E2I0_CUCME